MEPARRAAVDRVLPRAVVAFLLVLVPIGLAPVAGVGAMAAAALGGMCVIALALRWPPAPWRPAACRGAVPRYLLFALGWVPFMVAYLWAMRTLGKAVPPQPMLQLLAEQGLAVATVSWTAGVVVMGPVLEELLFRGYLLSVLRLWLRPLPAHLWTAAAFGAVHGPYYALPIGVLGLCFGWLRHRYDALLPSMLAHALHNGLTLAVVLLWPGVVDLLYPR